MRLSESLRKNILEANVGGIVNKFKLHKRRDILLFEEILAKYIKICEDAGYKAGMREAAKEWSFAYVKNFLPKFMEKLPKSMLLNSVIRKVLINIGLLDDLKAAISNGIITFSTYNEAITRHIGENEFCIGLWEGVISGLYRRKIETLSAEQSNERSVYSFSIKDAPFDIESKSKDCYIALNRAFTGNSELKRYLRMRIIVLKNNRMYFREKSVVLGENTLLHIFGNKGILIEKIPGISCSCFRDIMDPGSSANSRIVMLKNLLQVFGWGKVRILCSRDKIAIEIRNPPYGIQKGEDNWIFLASMILGYVFLIDRRYRISGIKKFKLGLEISYSISGAI